MLIVNTFFLLEETPAYIFSALLWSSRTKQKHLAGQQEPLQTSCSGGVAQVFLGGSRALQGIPDRARWGEWGRQAGQSQGQLCPRPRPNPAWAQPPTPGSLNSAPAAFPADTHISRRRVLVLRAALLALPAAGGARHPAAAGTALTVPHAPSPHGPAHATPLPRARFSRERRADPAPPGAGRAYRESCPGHALPLARSARCSRRPQGGLRAGLGRCRGSELPSGAVRALREPLPSWRLSAPPPPRWWCWGECFRAVLGRAEAGRVWSSLVLLHSPSHCGQR